MEVVKRIFILITILFVFFMQSKAFDNVTGMSIMAKIV